MFVIKRFQFGNLCMCFSSCMIFVDNATCNEGIWISKGSTTSDPYTREKGIVGILTVAQ